MVGLKEKGIKHIINLQSGFFEAFYNDQYETEQANDFGMIEYNFPLSDFSAPKLETIKKILAILDKANVDGELVYIHCKHGCDRTGFVVACYRMHYFGWTFDRARDEMFAEGFHKIPYLPWVLTLHNYAKEMKWAL